MDSLAERVDELESKLNESMEKNVGLSEQVKAFHKEEILAELAGDLTDIEGEKLKSLSEGVSFEDGDHFRQSLETIRENYFPRTVNGKIDEESEITLEEEEIENKPLSSSMTAYVNTLGSVQ